MTIEEKLTEMLFNCGLWPEEIAKILEEYKTQEVAKHLAGRWGDQMANYGPQGEMLVKITWVSLKKFTFEWLSKNLPLHWARAAFGPPEEINNIIAEQARLVAEKANNADAANSEDPPK